MTFVILDVTRDPKMPRLIYIPPQKNLHPEAIPKSSTKSFGVELLGFNAFILVGF